MARGLAPSRSLKYRSRDRRTQSAISFVCLMPPSPSTLTRAYASLRRPGGIHPDSRRQLHLIAHAQILAPELLKKKIDRVQLLLAGFKLIHVVPEARRPGEPLGVPGDMLARDLDPRFSAIERIEFAQMCEQHGMDFRDEGVREFLARGKIVPDF